MVNQGEIRIKDWGYLGLILIVFVVMLELAYRGYQYVSHGIPMFSNMQAGDDAAEKVAGATQLAISNPLLHYVLNPRHPAHTPDHFRRTPPVENAKITLVCMGGSSTYGTGLKSSETYPTRLQIHLNKSGVVQFKVLNAGVPGWTVPHHLSRYLHDIRHWQKRPDLVLLYAGYNDSWVNLVSTQMLIGHADRFRTFRDELPLWMSSRLLIWVATKVELVVGKNWFDTHLNDLAYQNRSGVAAINPANVRRYRDELNALLALLGMDGVKVLVVLQDTNGDFPGKVEREAFEISRNTMRDVATQHQLPVLDMHAVTHSDKRFFLDVIHMNAEGAELMSQALARKVDKLLSGNAQ